MRRMRTLVLSTILLPSFVFAAASYQVNFLGLDDEKTLKAMKDAYLNEVAKGITDPDIQRTKMLAAREKQRFKLRMA